MNEDQIRGDSVQTRDDVQNETRKKRWKRRRSWARARSSGITVMVLGGLLLLTALFLLVFPRSTVSTLENRSLTPFPKFSFAGLFNGEFTSGVTSHYDDTAPYRDSFGKLSNRFKSRFSLRSGRGDEADISKSQSDPEASASSETVSEDAPAGTVSVIV